MPMSSLRSQMALSSICSSHSVQVFDACRYFRSRVGSSAAWRAGWLRHADESASQPDDTCVGWACHPDVFTPQPAVSCLLIVSFVRPSAGVADGMVASYLPYVCVMESVVVTVCFRELLRDVCQKCSLPSPRYGIPVGSDGLISVYVEVEIPKSEAVSETIRIWGSRSSDADQSEEDAARRAIAKLRDDYAFEVKDANLEDKKFYEDLYARLSADHTVVRGKYKRLKNDYSLLKGYYNDLMVEKELLIAERQELMAGIEKCSEVFRRPRIRGVRPASSGEGSDEDPATPSNYRD